MFKGKTIARILIAFIVISFGSHELLLMEADGDMNSGKHVKKRLTSKMIMRNLLLESHTDVEILEIGEEILGGSTFITEECDKYEIREGYPFHRFKKASGNNLHAQSLVDVEYLFKAYDLSGDVKYLFKAQEIIADWMEYEQSEKSRDNIHLWYDHAVSFRAMNLIRLMLLEGENEEVIFNESFKKSVLNYIEYSGRWLYNEDNYSSGNHGLMMDAALLQCSLFGTSSEEKEKWFQRSIKRIKERIHNDFTEGGVNVENSSYYHKMITEFFIEIDKFFWRMDIREVLTKDERERILGMKKFLLDIIMPDGNLSPIGDTKKQRIVRGYDYPGLEYLVSNGERGEPEKAGVKYYKESGIALFREHFRKEKMKDSIWWYFKSGACSKMHKQDDDLSFMLYGFGNEIFTDGGKYDYDRTDPRRIRALSPLAHNSLSVDEKRYYGDRSFNRIDNLKMIEDGSKGYYHFRGVNRAYVHSHVIRNFIFFESNVIVLIDKIFGNEEKNFTQHFILGENMKIHEKDEAGFYAVSGDGKSRVRVNQHILPDGVEVFHGDEKSQKGFMFNSEKNIIPVDFIQYEKRGEACTYITSIILNEDDYEKKFLGLKRVKDGVRINISGEEYTISDKVEVSKKSLNEDLEKSLAIKGESLRKVDKNTYKYLVETYNNKVKYSFYIFKDGKKIITKKYSHENYILFSPESKGKYTCRYFILSEDPEDMGLDKKISDSFEEKVIVE